MSQALLIIEPPVAPHVPTRQVRSMVARMVGVGLSETEIAVALAIQPTDLRRFYREELEHGTAITTAKIGSALVKQALKGDVNAARLYLQCRAKWVAPTKVEVTGKDGGPVEIEHRRKLVESVLSRVRRLEARASAQEQAAPPSPSIAARKGAGGKAPPVTH